MLMKVKAIDMKTVVTVRAMTLSPFGPSKSIAPPVGGGIDGVFLSSAGVSWANCAAISESIVGR